MGNFLQKSSNQTRTGKNKVLEVIKELRLIVEFVPWRYNTEKKLDDF